MYNTISSNNSLIFWKQNINGSNIFFNGGLDSRLILKDNYLNVFSRIRDEIKSNLYSSFVALWHIECSNECKNVKRRIQSLTSNYNGISDSIENVVYKFRGNLGEIFAEAFFKSNMLSEICDGSTYTVVDPTNERFVDGDVMSNSTGLNIGVQVKNYDNELVPKKVFDKAYAEDSMRLRIDKSIPDDRLAEYISTPHQMIFSFTDSKLAKLNENSIIFIGPSYIDSKHLQGDRSKNILANWRFFDKICNEIENVI